jgi:hypothetical protein
LRARRCAMAVAAGRSTGSLDRSEMRLLRASILLFILPLYAFAGGSFLEVEVREFVRSSDTEYRMVIARTPQTSTVLPDPYMGKNCPLLTVVGQFRKLGGFPKWISRETHMAAMSMLETARAERKAVNFGWMGQGLAVIDLAKPCIMRSRALDVMDTGQGVIAVISYYAAV